MARSATGIASVSARVEAVKRLAFGPASNARDPSCEHSGDPSQSAVLDPRFPV
jgi:hypothetical protein